MRTRLNVCGLLVSTLLLSLSLCRAQQTLPAIVTYNFDTNSNVQLWDLTGTYSVSVTLTEKNGISVPLTLAFNIVQDAAGNLHGVARDFQAISFGDGNLFTVTYTIIGRITTVAGAPTARFVVRFVGNGTEGSLPNVNFSAILLVDAVPNAEDGQLEGNAKFSAKLGGGLEGVSGTISPFSVPLPPGVDGTWILTLQLLGGRSLIGSAIITTDAGQTMGFTVSGPLNANSTNSAVFARLRGSGAIASTSIGGVGSSATISTDFSFDSGTLSGKLMGQTFLGVPLPSPE